MTSTNVFLPVSETFYGYIETTRDSLLIFEACKRGILPRITRRLQDKERLLIRSGTIFCFDEKESGIKRWTDGLVWSPSRIMGNFLIYRELEDKKMLRAQPVEGNNEFVVVDTSSRDGYIIAPDLLRRQREKALVGSLKTSYKFKRNGLIKKSMSLIVDGVQQHIVSYYNKEDVLSGKLKTPSSLVELSSLQVSSGLRVRQNFRIPASAVTTATTTATMATATTIAEIDGSVTQRRNSKRKFSGYKSPSPTESESSLELQPNMFFPSKNQVSLTTVPQQSTSTAHRGPMNLDLNALKGQPFPLLVNETSYAGQQSNTTAIVNQGIASNKNKSYTHYPITKAAASTGMGSRQQAQHISMDKDFSNVNSSIQVIHDDLSKNYLTVSSGPMMASSRYDYQPSYIVTNDYHQGQNPHQHLFSSSSFHAVNHASIVQNKTSDIITTNSFMADVNLLLGTGWNEFELQM